MNPVHSFSWGPLGFEHSQTLVCWPWPVGHLVLHTFAFKLFRWRFGFKWRVSR